MIIIAIDPGYDRVGVAVLEKKKGDKEIILFSDCITTNSQDNYYQRLKEVGENCSRIIEKYRPTVMVLETLFFSKNTKTALQVSEARGIIIAQALCSDVSIAEFTPNQIKVAVTGYGKALKQDMYTMVKKLIQLDSDKKYIDDEIDAIATGITYFASTPLK